MLLQQDKAGGRGFKTVTPEQEFLRGEFEKLPKDKGDRNQGEYPLLSLLAKRVFLTLDNVSITITFKFFTGTTKQGTHRGE